MVKDGASEVSSDTESRQPNEGPRSLGQIAYSLHIEGTNDLTAPLTEEEARILAASEMSDRFTVTGQLLTFTSMGSRNQIVAEKVYSDGNVGDAESLYRSALNLFEHEFSGSDHAATRLIKLAGATRDVIGEGVVALKSRPDDAYMIESILGEVIAELADVQVASLRALGTAFSTADRLITSTLFSGLVRAFASNARLRLTLLDDQSQHLSEEMIGLYKAALLGLRDADLSGAIDYYRAGACSNDADRRAANMWALALLFGHSEITQEQCKSVEDTISPSLEDTTSDLHALACAVVAAALPSIRLCSRVWEALLREGDEAALEALVRALPRMLDRCSNQDDFPQFLTPTIPIGPARPDLLRAIDFALYAMLRAGGTEHALGWLTDWVRTHGGGGFNDLTFLSGFVLTVQWLIKNPNSFGSMITLWMLDDSRELPAAAGALLSHAQIHDAPLSELDLSVIDALDREGLIFLCRRILGFVFNEKQALSLILSLRKTKDAPFRTYDFVLEVLIHEIGYDYPTIVLQRLGTLKDETTCADELKLLNGAIERITSVEGVLDALPEAKELYPPSRLTRAFVRAREKDMSKKLREAQKDSIISQMATRVPVKGGSGFFHYQDSTYSGVTPMVPVHTTAALPRRDVLDLIGQASRRFQHQQAKRGTA